MNAATILDKLLPRWRAALPAEYSPEYIDGFLRRNRGDLEAFVAHAMTLHRARRGLPPRSVDEFAGYQALVVREQRHDPALEPRCSRAPSSGSIGGSREPRMTRREPRRWRWRPSSP